MPYSVEGKLVVAISSRALFDFEEENRVFERDGEAAYIKLQFERLEVPARHGVAFPLVKKLLAFGPSRVEVVVLSKNDPVSGLRVFRSAKQAGLAIERGVFTRGRNPYQYLDPLKANLFLSANENDVMGALDAVHAGRSIFRPRGHAARLRPCHCRGLPVLLLRRRLPAVPALSAAGRCRDLIFQFVRLKDQ